MLLHTTVLLTSILVAALLGFAAHRASICTVKAVEEVLTTRRAFMLLSFGKTVLWIMAITALLIWAVPGSRVNLAGWHVSLWGLLGGLVFGVGAVLNNGCAFSTLTRLGDGRLSMLLTLAGFAVGVAAHNLLVPPALMPVARPAEAFLGQAALWPSLLSAALALWGVWEAWRLWRTRPIGLGLRALVLADRYRLSTAALVLGLSNALLYALYGNWVYTATLGREVGRVTGQGGQLEPFLWLLFLGLVAGMAVSSWQRRRFRLDWRPSAGWVGNAAGGVLMGFGAALVPGGNDALILHGIPTLSPHALPAYAAMLLGIAASLGLTRLAGARLPAVDCSGDICSR